MVRRANWKSSITMGLLLAWHAAPALSQQLVPGDVSPASGAASDYQIGLPGENGTFNYHLGTIENGTSENDGSSVEVIKERFPGGAVKIEREVTQDAQGNYINHGSWKMWDQKGNVVAQGQYDRGNRTGEWIRWYRSVTEAELLSKPPYQQFAGPFISQATFENDQLHGSWIIYDGKTRKISEIRFNDGRRDGEATWYHPNGRKLREIQYRENEIDGAFTEWNAEGVVTVKDTYQSGRKLGRKTANQTPKPGVTLPAGAKKSEGIYLFAKEIEKTPDDWWNCKLMTTTKTGNDEKHGAWTAWHPGGQKQQEGTFEHDVQVGKFTWWYANGQKAQEGEYNEGKMDGPWVWWYESGQKKTQGEYSDGVPTGRWTWWKEDGKVERLADLSHSEGIVVDTPKKLDKVPQPRASKPIPKPPVQR